MANLEITLQFNEGDSPPEPFIPIIIIEKETRVLYTGHYAYGIYYLDCKNAYGSNELFESEVLWARKPIINSRKILIK